MNGEDIRRALTQRLQSLQRAGLTYLPRSEPGGAGFPACHPPTSDSTQENLSSEQEIPASRQESLLHTPAPVRERSLFHDDDETPAGKVTVAEHERVTLALAEREEKLAVLRQQVAACTRCQELAQSRTQTVFGVGNPQARIMFVGEAPGADEDRQGEPFVGRAGQLLDRIIAACRLTRQEIYICNILRCRPPGNRNPLAGEAANCREYLDGQIAIVDPDYIVCWGTVAAQNLLDVTTSIGRMRQKFFTYGRAKVTCTYHPSYLLRNPSAKKDVWDDMKWLMRDMGVELDGT